MIRIEIFRENYADIVHSGTNISIDGLVQFDNIVISRSGTYNFKSSFSFDMQACLNSTEFCIDFGTEYDQASSVCALRKASFKLVKVVVDIPMRPSGIRFGQQPVIERAGVRFQELVSCEMYDEYGNVLNTDAYSVEIVVTSASGSGCYFNRDLQSYPYQGIQVQVGGQSENMSISSPGTLQTSGGIVTWDNLLCNVASEGCSE